MSGRKSRANHYQAYALSAAASDEISPSDTGATMRPLTASEEENCHREFSVGDTVALRDNIHEHEGTVVDTYPHGTKTVLPGHVLSSKRQYQSIEWGFSCRDPKSAKTGKFTVGTGR